MTCRLPNRMKLTVLSAAVAIGAVALTDQTPVAAQQQTVTLPSDNPLSGDPAAIEAGRRLYNTWCSQCHGPKADGVAPRFGNYAANLTKFSKGYTEFAMVVVAGRPDRQMPPWDGVLDGEQISQIGAYLETLAVEGANWEDF